MIDASVYVNVCINVLNFTAFNYLRDFDKFKIFSQKDQENFQILFPSGLGNFHQKVCQQDQENLEQTFTRGTRKISTNIFASRTRKTWNRLITEGLGKFFQILFSQKDQENLKQTFPRVTRKILSGSIFPEGLGKLGIDISKRDQENLEQTFPRGTRKTSTKIFSQQAWEKMSLHFLTSSQSLTLLWYNAVSCWWVSPEVSVHKKSCT